jgi:hypothetical protein
MSSSSKFWMSRSEGPSRSSDRVGAVAVIVSGLSGSFTQHRPLANDPKQVSASPRERSLPRGRRGAELVSAFVRRELSGARRA